MALLVGNGLMFDFLACSGASVADWHPQRFTAWSDKPVIGGLSVEQAFPRLFKYIKEQRSQRPDLTDFDVFERMVLRPEPVQPKTSHVADLDKPGSYRFSGPDFRWPVWEALVAEAIEADRAPILARIDHDIINVEARHFILHSLIHLQRRLITRASIQTWRWFRWIIERGSSLIFGISFNYDRLVEDAADLADLFPYRVGLAEERGEFPIWKPHGSIDFESSSLKIATSYPLSGVVSRNDFPIRKASLTHEARVDAEIVLPAEASTISKFQWVAAGRRLWADTAPDCTDLVIAGLSYWQCDRLELDLILDSVPNSATIWMCNPHPSADWVQKLEAEGRSVRISAGPPSL